MTTISRRAALGGLGMTAAAGAAGAALAADGEAVQLAALIWRADEIEKRVGPLLNLADEMHPAFDPARVEDVRRLEDQANAWVREVMDYPVTQADAIAAKLRYLLARHERGALTEWDALDAVLSMRPAGVLS